MSDATLVMRVASGEKAALVALYDRYCPILLALGQHMLGAASEAEELVHDVFLDVWQHAAGYTSEKGSVRTWLTLLTRNMALEMLNTMPELADQAAAATFTMSDWTSRNIKPHSRERQLTQERLVVQQTLTHLNDDQRAALELAFFSGLSEPDIGQRLGLPLSMLRTGWQEAQVDLHQALQDIRKDL